MKEITFIKRNRQTWDEFEKIIENPGHTSSDKLAGLYLKITNDLAYSKTYFPSGKVTAYLNELASKAHFLIYRNKKTKQKSIFKFWTHTYPLLFREIRKEFLISSIIFFIAVLIGILSVKNDRTFVRLILGNDYVNMTEEYIKNGEPMAVYKSMNQAEMFLGITLNNIKVAFFAFVSGITLSIGTGYLLFSNGVMLGTFQCFFAQKGLFLDSFSTIWIHGTIEIFSILVAGAAGLVLGNSILFPGTYTRKYSFSQSVRKSAKIVGGLVPFFIIAGFLEGFVTRYANMPLWIKLSIIIASLIIIIFYFFIYPEKLKKSQS